MGQPGKAGLTRVLVTGASGFVGRPTCEFLSASGHAVTAAVRTSAAQTDRSVAIGDIGPQTDWTKALKDCDAVVHLAAHVHVMHGGSRQAADFHRVNAEGSERLAMQAAQAGVRRLIYLSSVKVNGEVTEGRAFTETDPPEPVDEYGISKAEAEKRLRAVAGDTGLEVVILRPPLVYGPGVKANFLQLLRIVNAGMPLPFSTVDNRRSLLGVGNLAQAIEGCLVHPAAANRTFFVSDDHDVSTPGLIREIAVALGRPARLFPFPMALLHGAGRVTGRAEQIARLTGSLQIDVSALKDALGWRPRHSLRQGLERTAAWFRTQSK